MKEKTRNILVGLIAVMLPLLALGQEEASEPATPFASKVVVPEVPYEFSSSEEKEVTVLFRLNADGRPLDLEVESAPSRAYADSVREAVRRWRFDGVEADPKWTNVRYRLPVVFTSRD